MWIIKIKEINIKLSNNRKFGYINFDVVEKLKLTNYITPNLRYQNIQSCLLIQEKQFISNYTILGYLEAITSQSIYI